jgi:prepilin-type N-terminal cleavage/methylation domain-containing protein
VSHRRNHFPRRAPGFTLIELTLALVIVAILMLSVHSVLALAARLAPNGRNASSATTAVAKGIEMLNFDLPYATSIVAKSATSITFTVPDRNGDGQAETIRYSWSGVSGDPLIRSVNSSDATVVSKVGSFQLLYDMDATTTQNYADSAETLLNSYDSLLSLGDCDIDSNNWVGQYFTPTLPSNAVSWRVTRVKIKARPHGAATAGETRVQIRRAKNGLPTAITDETVMYESNLSLLLGIPVYAWQEFVLPGTYNFSPSEGACLVMQWQKDADACDIQAQTLAATGTNSNMVKTTDGGVTWTTQSAQDLMFYVYGTYKAPSTTTTTYTLKRVRVKITPSSDSNATVYATYAVLNPQQVTP